MSLKDQRQAIYLYDDKVLITFNYKEGTETVAFGEAVKAEKSSDMSAREKARESFCKKREGWMMPALLTGADTQISILCPHILPA